jgi:soluble lytic murein transglycosylase
MKPDSGVAYTETEWLAGWIALEHLKPSKPSLAREHFNNAYESGKSINTRSKAAYWLGRSNMELGDTLQANKLFELSAKQYPSTFYGQVAALAAYSEANIAPLPSPQPVAEIQEAFNRKSSTKAIIALDAIGADRTALRFARAAMESMASVDEFALMAKLGLRIGRPDIAVFAGKIGGREGYTLGALGYPTLNDRYNELAGRLDRSLTHAIVWQESGFNPLARSGAGAQGYMQLMPTTASYTAKMLGMPKGFGQAALASPADNLKLGTTYFNYVLKKLDGYVPEAVMGYNAGPGRPVRWRQMFGDPFCRSGNDPGYHRGINGIEAAMFTETRDYAKYVLAAEQVYRPILAGGKTSLSLGERLSTECRGERSAKSRPTGPG